MDTSLTLMKSYKVEDAGDQHRKRHLRQIEQSEIPSPGTCQGCLGNGIKEPLKPFHATHIENLMFVGVWNGLAKEAA